MPMLGFLLGAVPWKEIVTATPRVMEVAAKLLDNAQQRRRPTSKSGAEDDSLPKLRADLERQLGELERHEIEQTELISQMAQQEEALLRGMQALSTRVTILFWALVVAVAVAITALVIALL